MKTQPNPKRGRPKTPLLDRLRVVAWAHHVMEASGARTAEEFELRYSKAKAKGKVHLSRGLWSRYLRGETLPQSAVSRNERSLIKRLDDEFPGTGDIFSHPVWSLLDFQQLLEPNQLLEAYMSLGEEVWVPFVNCIEKNDVNAPRLPGTFWSLIQSPALRKMRLAHLSGLDGIAACLIESRMGYLSQIEERFVTSMLASKQHFQSLSASGPFHTNRAKSALLAMEGYCIAYLERISVATCKNGETYTLLRSKKWGWQGQWGLRCQAHITKLSPSSLLVFKAWLRSAAAISPTRPERIGQGILLWLE